MVIDIVTTEPGLSSNMLASLIVLQRKSIHLYIHTDTLFPSNALMLLTSNHTDFVMYCTDHERPVQATVGTGCEPAAVNESISWRPHTMQAATHSARPHTNTVPSRYIQLFLYSVMITVHIKHLSVWYTGLSSPVEPPYSRPTVSALPSVTDHPPCTSLHCSVPVAVERQKQKTFRSESMGGYRRERRRGV